MENGREGIKEGMEKRKKESGEETKVQNNGTRIEKEERRNDRVRNKGG